MLSNISQIYWWDFSLSFTWYKILQLCCIYAWYVLVACIGERRRSQLLLRLQEQLESKKMIYSKNQLQLSSTMGQGIINLCL